LVVEKISAVTLRVANMRASVMFYRDLVGLEVVYGGEGAYFSSLRAKDGKDPILNLEHSTFPDGWGRIIFHVKDVDELWGYLEAKQLNPALPRNGAWGERYFHLSDPDGHELSFAKPIR